MDGGTDLFPPAAGYRLRPHAAWHWRCLCLDLAWRPLLDMRNLDRQEQNQRWQPYALQLANCRLLPSISPDELMQGFDDE